MKIAVASEGTIVAQHFGHCEGFYVYDVENEKVTVGVFHPNPGHKPGFLPNFLHEMGVTTVISGGMGGGAIAIFSEKGIQVITGASGESGVAAQAFVDGNLISTGSVCKDHQHSDSCGGH